MWMWMCVYFKARTSEAREKRGTGREWEINTELKKTKGGGTWVGACVVVCVGWEPDQHVNARTFKQFIIPVHFFGNLFSQSLLQISCTHSTYPRLFTHMVWFALFFLSTVRWESFNHIKIKVLFCCVYPKRMFDIIIIKWTEKLKLKRTRNRIRSLH